jgi:hypothetical protein
MGQSSSSTYVERNWEREAAINFHKRIKEYNYAYHGMYYDYVEWCRAQYELECIPELCRQGSGYRPRYEYGRKVY